jgi:hypothetical protein
MSDESGPGRGFRVLFFFAFAEAAQVGESNPHPFFSHFVRSSMWAGFPVEGHIADMTKAKEAKLARRGFYTLSDAEWAAEAVGGYYKPRMTRFKVWNFKKKAMKAMKDHDRKQQLLARMKHADDMLCSLRSWIFEGSDDIPSLDQLCKIDDRLVMLSNASWEMRSRAPDISLRELCRLRRMAKKAEKAAMKAKKAAESAASSSCGPRNRQRR